MKFTKRNNISIEIPIEDLSKTKENLSKILENFSNNYVSKIIKEAPILLNYLKEKYNKENIMEMVYQEMHDMPNELTICKSGKVQIFKNIDKGYKETCGTRDVCQCNKDLITQQWDSRTKESKQKVLNNRIATVQKKFGVDNVLQDPGVQQKIIETNLKERGVENPNQDPTVRQKIKDTCLQNYGFETNLQTPEVKKIITDKFGEKGTFGNSEIRQDIENWWVQNYGVKNPFQAEFVKEKSKETNLENHGVEFYSQSEAFKKQYQEFLDGPDYPIILAERLRKSEETFMKKYGVKHFKQKHISPETLQILSNKEKMVEALSTKSPKNLAEDWNINPSTIYQYCRFHEIPLFSNSSYERVIAGILDGLGVKYIHNSYKIIPPLQLDFYVEEYGIAIEENGLYHHSEWGGGKDPDYHANKDRRCTEIGIQLIQIFSDEIDNHLDIIKSKLAYLFGKGQKGVYARKTEIKEIIDKEAFPFYEQYHIQGMPERGQYNLGAFYNNELIGCMSFKCKDEVWTMNRFAGNGKSNPGLFSKILKHFIDNKHPTKIITFSDKRWTDGELYAKAGFIKEKEYKRGYYITDYSQREFRSRYMKSKIKERFKIDIEGKTERDLVAEIGLDYIWDAGRIRWALNLL